ncbi:hypothetical protein D9613_005746 [Agrocybe pediades]|uniref:Uncharacterized protein n=1 Tax=Agrocybe pediades TaxID=84607 RepID=A0A8H4VP82_9AGAR|nr:hypothetical protein D9613_005746 [Agrocybe pediades]KAF9562671.1 hypothetical protein CPC08DRAFT_761334 [Agrocybe pediades]
MSYQYYGNQNYGRRYSNPNRRYNERRNAQNASQANPLQDWYDRIFKPQATELISAIDEGRCSPLDKAYGSAWQQFRFRFVAGDTITDPRKLHLKMLEKCLLSRIDLSEFYPLEGEQLEEAMMEAIHHYFDTLGSGREMVPYYRRHSASATANAAT